MHFKLMTLMVRQHHPILMNVKYPPSGQSVPEDEEEEEEEEEYTDSEGSDSEDRPAPGDSQPGVPRMPTAAAPMGAQQPPPHMQAPPMTGPPPLGPPPAPPMRPPGPPSGLPPGPPPGELTYICRIGFIKQYCIELIESALMSTLMVSSLITLRCATIPKTPRYTRGP